jgi:ubiquinone/menaquinone biosynthesis C-methylase UbiE
LNDTQFHQVTADPDARQRHCQEMVKAYFERVTDTYRARWSDSFHFAVFKGGEPLKEALLATERWIADEAGLRAGMRVLDVGCGVGGPALNIAEHSGAHVTGVNLVERQLQIARRSAAERGLAERTAFVLGDAMRLDFADQSFDAAYEFEAGCHMPDKGQLCREVFRVLRPGGIFNGLDWMKRPDLDAAAEAEYIEPICRLFSVPHLATLGSFAADLEDAGFVVEVIEDVAVHGDILRNWEMVDNKAVRGVRGLLPFLIPPTLRMLTDSGLALSKAARAGAFLIGHWRARKPGGGV